MSSIHVLRPLFPGREPALAGFLDLIHGLAFAATLGQLGLGSWERAANLLAFNLGIEAMQLAVVAVTMPCLLLLSRTQVYSFLCIGGAIFAGSASVGWIAERLLKVHNPVDVVVDGIARGAVWIFGVLLLSSALSWALSVLKGSNNSIRRRSSA